MRLIDADALKDELKDLKTRLDPKSYGQKDGVNLAIARIEFMPTIEAEPVVHGHWIEDNERTKSYIFFCSNCNGKAYSNISGSSQYHVKKCSLRYCPNCGARMDEEETDGEHD